MIQEEKQRAKADTSVLSLLASSLEYFFVSCSIQLSHPVAHSLPRRRDAMLPPGDALLDVFQLASR